MAAHTTDNGVEIELLTGDITAQPSCDAVVNAANAELLPGGGVAGAIHRAAGPGLADECAPMAPIRPGQCVITSAHGLPNSAVIHCLGPVHGIDEPAAELLSSCYSSGLQLAEQSGHRSVAFPALSTGAFGYPVAEAAEIALGTVLSEAERLQSVRRVAFVLFDSKALAAHEEALERLTG